MIQSNDQRIKGWGFILAGNQAALSLKEFGVNDRTPSLKTRTANWKRSRHALISLARMAMALTALAGFGRAVQAGTLFWDTDGSIVGNNASSGANLGGSGTWNNTDTNWWDSSFGMLQGWTDGSDAVFWGTAGAVTIA